MKLLMCNRCGDVFNLDLRLKSCGCGLVKGKYENDQEAVVNGEGESLAIGNGSLFGAIVESRAMTKDPRKGLASPRNRHEGSIIAWVRPHEGPANPHTRVQRDLGADPS